MDGTGQDSGLSCLSQLFCGMNKIGDVLKNVALDQLIQVILYYPSFTSQK